MTDGNTAITCTAQTAGWVACRQDSACRLSLAVSLNNLLKFIALMMTNFAFGAGIYLTGHEVFVVVPIKMNHSHYCGKINVPWKFCGGPAQDFWRRDGRPDRCGWRQWYIGQKDQWTKMQYEVPMKYRIVMSKSIQLTIHELSETSITDILAKWGCFSLAT